MIVSAYRASRVLYNFLKSNFENNPKPWLLPANICDCVPETFGAAGLKYEYVDVSSETWCMDWKQVIDKIDDYAGLMYVHTYGVEDTPYAMFAELKNRNKLLCIIDDRCLCEPQLTPQAEICEREVTMELYSTGSKKQVNMHGGGYAFISNIWRYEEHPFLEELHAPTWNYDWEVLLNRKTEAQIHKAAIYTIYNQMLPSSIRMIDGMQNWRYNILVNNRDEIIKAIFNAGLFASAHYKSQVQGMTNCAYLHQHIINLFEDEYITIEQAKTICRIINDKLKNGI